MATGSQETSLIARDYIRKSELISEGSPARYRLLTTRSNLEKDCSVRKWTFGQRENNMQKKIILLVGETGTGKTTLINAMVNYLLGVKYEDEVWFEITEEGGDNDMSDQSQNQTTQITMYEVFIQDNPICLTVIDTPGYGDTRGTDHDKQIAENLCKLFHSDTGVREIDAVCLVLNASENRLTDRQQYIYDAVLSLLGKDIENNIVIFITHSSGLHPENVINVIKKAGIPCRSGKTNYPEYFLFNNRQTVKRSEQDKSSLQTDWERTETSLGEFFPSLKEENRRSVDQTERVLTETKQLQACISNLQKRVESVESKSKELAEIQKALQENQEKIKINENLTLTVTENYKVKDSTENALWWDRMATTCSVCAENCYDYSCWCARIWWPNWCTVMSNDHCTVYTGKCQYTKHVRERKKYVTRSKETTMTFNDLKCEIEREDASARNIKFDSKAFDIVKENIESNKKQEEEKKGTEKKLEEELDRNKEEKVRLVEETCNIIMKLCEMTLKPDSAFIVWCLDFWIPRVEETGKDDLVQKLRELRNIKPESEERVKSVMKYVGGGFSKL